MDYVLNSENLVWLAKWLAIVSLTLVVLISIAILVLRLRLRLRQRRESELSETWKPILVGCFEGIPDELPTLEERDIRSFLVLWNYFHESLRDTGKDNLYYLARRLSLDTWCLRSLDRGSIRDRLLAIQTLGWLRERRSWRPLCRIMESGDPVTSLCAAKALLRIDPNECIGIFIPMIPFRPHWSFSTVGKLLRAAGAEVVSETLVRTAELHEGEELVRILRFLRTAHERNTAPLISRLLRESTNPNVLAACLRAVEDPKDYQVIRDLLKHEDWKVRTQAAIRLGQIGTEEDVPRLVHAAGDQEWWVRFRAAIALAELPSMTTERLKQIAENHKNPFGHDVIMRVCQEKEAYE